MLYLISSIKKVNKYVNEKNTIPISDLPNEIWFYIVDIYIIKLKDSQTQQFKRKELYDKLKNFRKEEINRFTFKKDVYYYFREK
jgi:hypothetical protein